MTVDAGTAMVNTSFKIKHFFVNLVVFDWICPSDLTG